MSVLLVKQCMWDFQQNSFFADNQLGRLLMRRVADLIAQKYMYFQAFRVYNLFIIQIINLELESVIAYPSSSLPFSSFKNIWYINLWKDTYGELHTPPFDVNFLYFKLNPIIIHLIKLRRVWNLPHISLDRLTKCGLFLGKKNWEH